MADNENLAKENALREYYAFALAEGDLTRAQIKTEYAKAVAAMQDGVTVVEVTIEGGATRGQVNTPPHVVVNACAAILKETAPENTLANTDLRHKYADFSGGLIET